jgi:hypothetical protein
MTWFEEGLRALKAKDEKERHEKDSRRWLVDADSAILQDRNEEDQLASRLPVSTNYRRETLHLVFGNIEVACYQAISGGALYKPCVSDLGEKFPEQLLTSEEEFQKNLCKVVWTVGTTV